MKSILRSTLVVGLVSVIAIVTTTNSASAQVQAQPASRTRQVQQGYAYEGHALAEQWSGWLKGSGFDVSHAHPAEELVNWLKKNGFEVAPHKH